MFKQFTKGINTLKKGSIWMRLTIFLGIFLIALIIVNAKTPVKEGFSFEKAFVNHEDDNIYDEFYASVYDDLVHSEIKNDYEIGKIINITSPTDASVILDLGAGTGHHVKAFKDKGFKSVGIDKSSSMVKHAKNKFKDIDMRIGDFMKTMSFQPGEFTHITCLYFTIYYVKDKATFFSNCISWLKPGGYLIVHLVDREKFNPIIPAGDPFTIVSPQKYAKNRITTSNVIFNNFTYKAQFNADNNSKGVDIFPNDFVIFKEIFKDTKSGNVRQNSHKLYMESHKDILAKARVTGFIELAKVDLTECQYENQYVYIFQKPN